MSVVSQLARSISFNSREWESAKSNTIAFHWTESESTFATCGTRDHDQKFSLFFCCFWNSTLWVPCPLVSEYMSVLSCIGGRECLSSSNCEKTQRRNERSGWIPTVWYFGSRLGISGRSRGAGRYKQFSFPRDFLFGRINPRSYPERWRIRIIGLNFKSLRSVPTNSCRQAEIGSPLRWIEHVESCPISRRA